MSASDQVPVDGLDPVLSAHHRASDAEPLPDEYDEILAFAADIDTGDTTA